MNAPSSPLRRWLRQHSALLSLCTVFLSLAVFVFGDAIGWGWRLAGDGLAVAVLFGVLWALWPGPHAPEEGHPNRG